MLKMFLLVVVVEAIILFACCLQATPPPPPPATLGVLVRPVEAGELGSLPVLATFGMVMDFCCFCLEFISAGAAPVWLSNGQLMNVDKQSG